MNIIWFPVIHFPLEKDLLPLLAELKRQGIGHHVTEEKGQQQLWISDEYQVLAVAELSSQWLAGELALKEAEKPLQPAHQTQYFLLFLQLLRFFPVSIVVIILGILGALLVYFDTNTLDYSQLFLFQAVKDNGFLPWSAVLESNQYWRLITPIFLHFGPFHILFNGIVLWAMGSRIERVKGSSHYLVLIIIIGVVSNVAQYLAQANTAFGGLSGVVYGVIGYIAVYQTFVVHPLLQFNRAVIAFFIVWMLLGYTGIVDFFIAGSIANTAHLVGLLAGCLLGGTVAWIDTKRHYHS